MNKSRSQAISSGNSLLGEGSTQVSFKNTKKKHHRSSPQEMREKRRRYVDFVVIHGMNKKEAALAAGFTRWIAKMATHRVETPEVREEIARRTKPFLEPDTATLLIKRYKAGLNATMVEAATDETSLPDHSTRLQYAVEIALMGERHRRKGQRAALEEDSSGCAKANADKEKRKRNAASTLSTSRSTA